MVVPVVLGCCPHEPRCLLCPPADPPTADTVAALVAHYRDERAQPGASLQVRFFGGAPPSDPLLDAIGSLPFTARVRPDLLTRAEAVRLRDRGCEAIELDALTFDRSQLRAARRLYGPRVLAEQAEGLPKMGLEVGGVLAPGLPHSSFDTAMNDARVAAGQWRFARIHPVVVLAHSALRELHANNRYVALDLGAAVTVSRAMVDILEAAGLRILRVGLQAGPDGFGRAVAGPRHPGLRQLVEARRTLDQLRDALEGTPPDATVTVRCAPADETRTRGPFNQHVRTLRADHLLAQLEVVPDPTLQRGEIRVVVQETP